MFYQKPSLLKLMVGEIFLVRKMFTDRKKHTRGSTTEIVVTLRSDSGDE